MSTTRYQQLVDLCEQASSLPGDERESLFQSLTDADASLLDEARAMLRQDEAQGVLDSSAIVSVDLGSLLDESRALRDNPEPTPDRIGPYRILGVLGVGGMSVVYRAEQESPHRPIALKVLRRQLFGRKLARRLGREGELLAKLRHPGVAQIYEVGSASVSGESIAYIAMELVEGETLLAYANRKKLNNTTRLRLMVDLCDAIEHAHQRGVLHCDLKPANILVEEIDGAPRVKVVDFGVGRLVEDNDELVTRHTQQGQLLGTLAYMSPEQISGESTRIDTRTDIYALGVICYELLSGALPIDVGSGSVLASIHAVCERAPRALGQLDPRLKGDVSVVVARALAKEPDERHASASALGEDLRRIISHRPILSRPPSRAYAVRKFAARHPVGVSMTALATFAILAGASGSLWGMVQYRAAATELTQQNEQMNATSNLLIHEVMTNLSRLTGTTALRQHTVEQLSANITALLEQHPDDTDLLKNQAMAFELRSDLVGVQDVAAVIALRKKALDIRQRLLAADPHNPTLLSTISINIVKIGDLQKDQGDFDSAQTCYEKALEIDETLARDHPTNRDYLDNLGWSYDRLTSLAINQNDADAADRFAHERQRVNASLLKLAPNHPLTLFSLWSTHIRLYELASMRGRSSLMIQESQAAVDAAQNLVASDPQNRDYLLALFDSLAEKAGSLIAVGRLDEAKAAALKATPIVNTLLRLDPNIADSHVKNITQLDQLSDIALKKGDPAEALALAGQAVADAEQTLPKNPVHYALFVVSTGAWIHQMEAQVALGDLAAADRSYARITELFRRRVEMSHHSDASQLTLARWLKTPPPSAASKAPPAQ